MEYWPHPYDELRALSSQVPHSKARSGSLCGREGEGCCLVLRQHWLTNIGIHCETTGSPPYSTICVDNSKSSFSTLYFLKSLSGSVYEPLVKEVEKEIDQKAWQTKEGLLLRAQIVASKVRCLIQSMATMTAANRTVASAIMPLTISRGRGTEGASAGSTRNVLPKDLLQPKLSPRPTVDNRRGQTAQSHPLPLDLKERAQMCKDRPRLARPQLLSRFPPNLSQAKSLTTPKSLTSTTSSGQSAKAASSSRWTRSTMCTLTSLNVHRWTGLYERTRSMAWRSSITTSSTCLIGQPGRRCAECLRQRKDPLPSRKSRTEASGSLTGSIVLKQADPCRTWTFHRVLGNSSRSGTTLLCGPRVRKSCKRSQRITTTSTISAISSPPGRRTFLRLGLSGRSWAPLFPQKVRPHLRQLCGKGRRTSRMTENIKYSQRILVLSFWFSSI